MPTYITLANYTDQGIRGIKDAPKRLAAARDLIKSKGGKLTAFYLTLGSYDIVTVGEAPDDETIAKVALTIGAGGNIRTTTLRAFTEAEFLDIVKDVG